MLPCMADQYYAQVYLRGCGEMIGVRTEVDLETDPVLGKMTIWFIKPEDEEAE
jgi:hypothetical protein